MVCIYCQSKTHTVNSRPFNKTNTTWRRRRCLKCEATFTTFEETDYSRAWVVTQKDGSFEPFSRDKLYTSNYDSLRHRKTAVTDATAITATIISKVSQTALKGQIEKDYLMGVALSCLKRLDPVAGVHYKAYYAR